MKALILLRYWQNKAYWHEQKMVSNPADATAPFDYCIETGKEEWKCKPNDRVIFGAYKNLSIGEAMIRQPLSLAIVIQKLVHYSQILPLSRSEGNISNQHYECCKWVVPYNTHYELWGLSTKQQNPLPVNGKSAFPAVGVTILALTASSFHNVFKGIFLPYSTQFLIPWIWNLITFAFDNLHYHYLKI